MCRCISLFMTGNTHSQFSFRDMLKCFIRLDDCVSSSINAPGFEMCFPFPPLGRFGSAKVVSYRKLAINTENVQHWWRMQASNRREVIKISNQIGFQLNFNILKSLGCWFQVVQWERWAIKWFGYLFNRIVAIYRWRG